MAKESPNDSWHNPNSQGGKAFVGFWRKVYNPLGFKKGYNFPLFVILVGAMMGFVLARISYLNYAVGYLPNAMPGEAFWYSSAGSRRIGIILHLATILPAGFLVCFQFVPVIRHKLLIFHRINGYIILSLFLPSLAGIFMITRHVAGGDPNTQAAIGAVATLTTVSLCLAYYNIKRLQIDQHRAWMIRAWVYAGSIISLRLIMLAANRAVNAMGDYYVAMQCAEIFNDYAFLGIPDQSNPAFQLHPQCLNANTTTDSYIAVHADTTSAEGVGAQFALTFGMSTWIALFIHAIGVEIYLTLTPAETERLRVFSYEKQLEAGFRNPGSAGLTVDRLGDAQKWIPPLLYNKRKSEEIELLER